jgi:glutaconate CoA-transferase, subunit B
MNTTSVRVSPSVTPSGSVSFLVRSSKPFRRGGWVFTGFHWPVLAGTLASLIDPSDLVQVYEGGAACNDVPRQVPSSTADSYAYGNALCVQMTTADVLLALMRRFDCAVLDASNVDLLGRVNSSAIGPIDHPIVRLPGGGGSADAMARAKHVVLLHGSTNPDRIVGAVEHVTAAPATNQIVELITRWGVLELGEKPNLVSIVDGDGAEAFQKRLLMLGVDTRSTRYEAPVSDEDALAAQTVLRLAAERGYLVARQALESGT